MHGHNPPARETAAESLVDEPTGSDDRDGGEPRRADRRDAGRAKRPRFGGAFGRALIGVAVVAAAGTAAGALTLDGPTTRVEPRAEAATAATVTDEQRQRAAERAARSERTTTTPPPTNPARRPPTRPAAPAPTRTRVRAKPAPKWVNPMPGVRLSSCFGPRWGTRHQGLDFAGPAGTRIVSVGSGRVVSAGWDYGGYGISVLVDHGHGLLSHYAHASRALVGPGQRVRPGQPIAVEGSTGNSTGPHLHFEVHRGLWNQVDPAAWLRSRGVAIGC